MAGVAQRGELLQRIVALVAEVGVGAMMHLQAVARITRPAAVAVPFECAGSEPPPLS
jgi:hypothetical protein